MKKILFWLLTLTIALPALARDFEYTYEGQTLTYTVLDEDAKTCTTKEGKSLNPGNKVTGELKIPATVSDGVNDYSVVKIGDGAFYGCSGMKSVTIPNSVTAIGANAFDKCYGLTSVTIPNSVTSIGDGAFFNCSGLKSVNISNSVTVIGTQVFALCSNLTSVIIPNSLTTISRKAFEWCYKLRSVTIPNSVTYIREYAFDNCTDLLEIHCDAVVPPKLHYDGCFGGTPSNKILYVPTESVSTYKSSWGFSNVVGVEVGESNESKFMFVCVDYEKISNKEGCVKVIGARADLTTLEIPATVQNNGKDYQVVEIAENAFEKNSALTEITIPASVVDIKSGAFKGCTSLSKLTLLDGSADLHIDNIWVNNGNSDSAEGEHAFRNCPLQRVYIGRNLKYVSDNAYGWSPFAYTPIYSATFGEGVTNFPSFLFHKCNRLYGIDVPSTLTEIEDNNFSEYGLCTCPNLQALYVAENNPSFTSVDGVLYDKNQSKLLLMPISHCTSWNYTTSLEIPVSVTEIGRYALHNCKNLTSVTIPSSISKIGKGAFFGCTGLQTVVYEAARPIEINEENIESYYENVFSDETYSKAELWINSSALQLVKSTNPWSKFAKILYTALVLNVSELSMAEGDTEQIMASTSKGEELTSGLVWTSSDTSIATVSDNGLITAVGLGKATITCKWISPKGEELSQAVAVEVKDYVLRIKLPNGYTELLGAARNSYKFRFGCEEGYSLHQAFIDDKDITSEITASSDLVYEVKPARKDRVLYAIFRSDVNTGIETTEVANSSKIKFTITEGHISIEGAQPGSEVSLYDINGRILKSTTDHSFDLEYRGVMILRVDGQTFKFIM